MVQWLRLRAPNAGSPGLIPWKEESEKAGLKLNIQKTKIMASGPITSWQLDGEKWKQWQILFSWAPESLRTVTAAMKLKDACSLEEGQTYNKPRQHINRDIILPTKIHIAQGMAFSSSQEWMDMRVGL